MNRDIVRGNWKQLRGQIKHRWGQLTHDGGTRSAGRRDQIVGVLQEHYGYERQRAKRELNTFIGTLRKRMPKLL